jgi:hypothetical protein
MFLFGLPGLWASTYDNTIDKPVLLPGKVVPRPYSITELEEFERITGLEQQRKEDEKILIKSQEELATARSAYEDEMKARDILGDICGKALPAIAGFAPYIFNTSKIPYEKTKALEGAISGFAPLLTAVNGG